MFRFCARVRKVRPFRRQCLWLREETYDLFSQTGYLLVQACQRLWLAGNDDVYQAFTCVDLTTPPSLRPPLALAGTPLPHGFDARLLTTATLSQALHTAALPQPHGLVGTTGGTVGFVLSAPDSETVTEATCTSHHRV